MKRIASFFVIAALIAFNAPVFAATNPFMDVPMNHWAYDAIGQLAAHGIISGYPDGTYKGTQQTTRYEMASALARALAVVDMTKAGEQDVEMLRKLVVEFRDELEALGVRVDELDERVKVLEDRLGGWHMHIWMRFDIEEASHPKAPDPDGQIYLQRARLYFERWFGDEDNPMHFVGRIDTITTPNDWEQFYVEMPFFFDTQLTVGKFLWDAEGEYYLDGPYARLPNTGGYQWLDSLFSDRQFTAVGILKRFSLGDVRFLVSHPTNLGGNKTYSDESNGSFSFATGRGHDGNLSSVSAWEFFGAAKFQINEKFGFDIGGHAYIGDNAEPAEARENDLAFDNLWTLYGGVRFNFTDDIILKGIFYHQQYNGDVFQGDRWVDNKILDDSNHWRVALDIRQSVLKFTSLWLEYGQMDKGFYVPQGLGSGFFTTVMYSFAIPNGKTNNWMWDDVKFWRVALGQQWNEKWGTTLFYYNYDFDKDEDLKEYGAGVQYRYSPEVTFGLNYVHFDWGDYGDDNRVNFRTEVVFW